MFNKNSCYTFLVTINFFKLISVFDILNKFIQFFFYFSGSRLSNIFHKIFVFNYATIKKL